MKLIGGAKRIVSNEEKVLFCKKHNFEYLVSQEMCPICKMIRDAGTWDDIWNKHSDEPEQQKILVRGAILGYESGQVLRLCTYIGLNENDVTKKDLVTGWKADLKSELSDVFCQAILLCELLGWNYYDIMDYGKTRIRKRTVNQMFSPEKVTEGVIKK